MYGELIPMGGGDTIPLMKKTLLIGRRESCDIVLRFANVSAHHAQLSCNGGYWYVRDLKSRNGVKVAGLRIFSDRDGAMNRSVVDIGGRALVISQFTLFGDVRRGRRPSFVAAMKPEGAERLYRRFVERLEELGVPAAQGVFGAMMQIRSTNDGPVTILLDSKKLF